MKNRKNIILSSDDRQFLYDEWLVTNGLGGYACGSVGGVPMRKYNGLLIAALKAPHGRAVMLSFIEDTLLLPRGGEFPLTQLRTKEKLNLQPCEVEFRIESNCPIWSYHIDDIHLEKRIWMSHGQNTVHIRYHLLSGADSISIRWRPFFHFRNTEQSVQANEDFVYHIHTAEGGYEVSQDQFPIVRMINDQHSPFTIDATTIQDVFYEIEEKRGYDCYGSLTSPGYFTTSIPLHGRSNFSASTDPWEVMEAMNSDEALNAEIQRQKSILRAAKPILINKSLSKLVLAADQFLITPIYREKDAVRLTAVGEDVRSVIAGYPWFTDWGRDTMISLEGLTLTTGRPRSAKAILRTFAYYIHKGLIPNMFPDGKNEGLYHTADATLWFFHAVDRYVALTKDEDFLEFMIPKFHQILEHHIKGTLFGIKMDSDGLLIQGQEGYQLTWMDAKVKDWVVTPRRGKAVEICALWYNALRLMELWTGDYGDIAKKCRDSFNKKFWYEKGGYLYDVINDDKKDASLRPNQLFSISLRFPVLNEKHWKPVLDKVKEELLTPLGLRTLSRSDPDFKAYYEGDLWARDAAYHQGTVWPWLIGPFIDAWLKVYPEKIVEAQDFLKGLELHIDENCIGSIAEIFDALDPSHARGCFAQAWSVAEFLRSFVKVHTELDED